MKNNKEVKTSIVETLIKDDKYSTGTIVTSNPKSIFSLKKNNKFDKIKIMWIILLSLMILFVIVLIIAKYQKPNDEKKISSNLYNEAYNNLNFKEDNKLDKLYCYKDLTENTQEVKSNEVIIYYFDDNEMKTYIYHKEISLSDEYMDYFDETIKQHKNSLSNDYPYPNVKSNIVSNGNKILVTVITNKSNDTNAAGLPVYINYEAAKQSLEDANYECK